MARNIYGDSYGQISSLEQGMDQARDNRIYQGYNAGRAQQQARNSTLMSLASMLASLRENQTNRQIASQQFEQSRADRLLAALTANEQFRQNLALQREQLRDRTGRQDYSEALNLASQGLLDDQGINQLYPQVPAGDRARISAVRQNLAARELANETEAETAAQNLNNMFMAARKAEARKALGPQPKMPELSFWQKYVRGGPSEEQMAPINTYNTRAEALMRGEIPNLPNMDTRQSQAVLNNYLRNRRFQELVGFDESNPSQPFSPAPQPRVFNPRAAVAPTNGAPANAPAAPVAAPAAAARPAVAQEIQAAQAAIARGKDPQAVRAFFKQRTGMDLP